MANPGVATLPEEVLSIVCLELASDKDRDFASLYRCALASKSFADSALRTMYAVHQYSPAFEQRDEMDVRAVASVDFATKASQQVRFYQRWTLIWRSIILSSLHDDGALTYKPYCRYIRTLDFRNLTAMLEDLKFTGAIRKAFFAGPLQRFHFPKTEYRRQVVDVVATLNAVGEAVTAETTMLAEIDGHLSPGFLPRWISRSPKLQSMVLWKGDALADGAGSAVAQHCENFTSLTIHEWTSLGADESFATFLSELRQNTMAYFEMISFNSIGKLSFEALGRHKTLQELDLGNLNDDAVRNLNALKGCTSLRLLKLDGNNGTVQLEANENDVFLEVTEWLASCKELRDLSLKNFYDGPGILACVLGSPDLKLTRLSLEGYIVRHTSAQLFHSALSDQKSLDSVWLKGIGEGTTPDDLQIMVEGLCNLTNLRELVLKDVSDEFDEEHIISLALSLPMLEEFWTSGGSVSADILTPMTNLKYLRTLTLYAMTQFHASQILEFLSDLDPEAQKGFNLSLMAADPAYDITEESQDMIREYIRTNLDGRFDFVLWREEETSDSDDD